MFDEKKQPDSQPPVEDMFSGTERDLSPASTLQPLAPPPSATPAASAPAAALPSYEPHHGLGVMKVVFVVLIVLLLVAGAAYGAYSVMVRQPSGGSVVNSVPDSGVTDDTGKDTATTGESAQTTLPATRPSILDSDGDGLSNAEELDAGTLSNKADTDSDGLGDREEVKVYGTDPRNADTDGDTFLDGQEVAGGYNPNGEGRLFTVPTSP